MSDLLKRKDFISYEDYKASGTFYKDNLENDIWKCKAIIAGEVLDKYYFETLFDSLKSILVNKEIDVKTLSPESLKSVCKVLLRYAKKELVIIKRRYRAEDKAEKERNLARTVIESGTIEYNGHENKRLLSKVVYELSLYSKITKKSVISLHSNCYSRTLPNSDSRYTFTGHYASGYITIDGIDYSFDDIKYHETGWDHFPPG